MGEVAQSMFLRLISREMRDPTAFSSSQRNATCARIEAEFLELNAVWTFKRMKNPSTVEEHADMLYELSRGDSTVTFVLGHRTESAPELEQDDEHANSAGSTTCDQIGMKLYDQLGPSYKRGYVKAKYHEMKDTISKVDQFERVLASAKDSSGIVSLERAKSLADGTLGNDEGNSIFTVSTSTFNELPCLIDRAELAWRAQFLTDNHFYLSESPGSSLVDDSEEHETTTISSTEREGIVASSE